MHEAVEFDFLTSLSGSTRSSVLGLRLPVITEELRRFFDPVALIHGPVVNPELVQRVGTSIEDVRTERKWAPLRPSLILDAIERLNPQRGHLLVTDLDLEPPETRQYIIWHRLSVNAVVSTSPLDPLSWNATKLLSEDEERFAMDFLHHRLRSVCVGLILESMGCRKCEFEDCFLYGGVDSVGVLDDMRYFGAHHRDDNEQLQLIINRGFEFRMGLGGELEAQEVVCFSTPPSASAA